MGSWKSKSVGRLQARSRQPLGVQREAVAGEAGQVCRRQVGLWEVGMWEAGLWAAARG